MSGPTFCNVILFGAAESGKTQLISKLANIKAEFNEQYRATIGADFLTKEYKDLRITIWDTAGQERFQSLTYNFVKDAHINILCVDLSRPLDTQNIDQNIEKIRESTDLHGEHKPLILVWTKSDAEQTISDNEILALNTNKEYNFTSIITVSSKENSGITELLDLMATKCSLEVETANDLDKALGLLSLYPNSPLYTKTKELRDNIEHLSSEKKQLIETTTLKLITTITQTTDPALQANAVSEFEQETTKCLGGAHPKIKASIVSLIVTALITVIAMAIGFGIGFAAGLWTGPGAFISGVLAGSAAECTVVSMSAAGGVSLGIFSFFANHGDAMKQNQPIYDYVNSVKEELTDIQPSL